MDFPRKIDIELNTNCNLSCDFCPYLEEHKDPQFMNVTLYNKIIDQIDWKCSIKLCQRGEPLLSPLLIYAIKKARNKGLRTVINTNGLLLNIYGMRLLKAGLETLILSDYGMKKQLENGKRFQELNDWYYRNYRTFIEFIVKTERPEAWEGIADKIIKPIYYDHSGNFEDDTPLPNWACNELFDRLIIQPDGRIRCCCGYVHCQKYVGNIYINTIEEIWNSDIMILYRNIHLDGNSHELEMCRKCDYRRSIIKNG